MEIVADQKQVSNEERAQISRQVKAELVEHLYRGCLPGTTTGALVGIAIFIDFYGQISTLALASWAIYYGFCLVLLTFLYFYHKNYGDNHSLNTWLIAYSISMSLCAISWGVCPIIMPDNITREYAALLAILMVAGGYATGSIGVFELCIATLTIILVPIIVWSFIEGGFLHNLVGVFTAIYFSFLLGINHRSTQWFKDSLKLKLENTLVSYQANHDVLTDLPNQRMLPQFIESTIAAVKNTRNTFALVCFSLNRMEMINDSLGLQAGSTIIQSVATRFNYLVSQIAKRKNEPQYIITISRKDTFNIIVSPLNPEEVEEKIKILFSILDEPFYLEQKGVKITASIGVSIYSQTLNEPHALMTGADSAMLKAKQIGGNRLEFFKPDSNSQSPKQLELETDLYAVLEKNQLKVFYQPLVNIKTGEIGGMEALLRWIHPTRGFISPVNFIPLAEETGLIVPIGEWVLNEACKQTKIWHEMGYSKLKIAVNLSEKQIRAGNIVETITKALTKTNFDPKFLELEITETAILDESIIHLIEEFKKLGLSLAVDDFGTGYSGLSYLKRFSINKIKIDQSFIRDIPGSNDSITIVSAIIAMAKELNITTLAEGVETIEQLNFLKSKGCDYVQGYYYSKPVEASLFTQLLIDFDKAKDKVGANNL